MPHLEQKSSNCWEVKTLAPSVVSVTGMPNMVMYCLSIVSVSAVVSLVNLKMLNQLLYLSTTTR